MYGDRSLNEGALSVTLKPPWLLHDQLSRDFCCTVIFSRTAPLCTTTPPPTAENDNTARMRTSLCCSSKLQDVVARLLLYVAPTNGSRKAQLNHRTRSEGNSSSTFHDSDLSLCAGCLGGLHNKIEILIFFVTSNLK